MSFHCFICHWHHPLVAYVTDIIPLLLTTSPCCTCHQHHPFSAPVTDIVPLLHLLLISSPCCICHWCHLLVSLISSPCCTCCWHHPFAAPVSVTDIIPLLHVSLTSSPCYTCCWHHPFAARVTDIIPLLHLLLTSSPCCTCCWHPFAARVTDIVPLLHLLLISSPCCVCHWCCLLVSLTSSPCCICHWHHPLGVHIDHWSWRQRRMESLWCWKGAHKAKSIFQWILWYGCSFESVGLLFIGGQILLTLIIDVCYSVRCSWAIHWNRCSCYEIHMYTQWIILLLIFHNIYVYNRELTITIKDLAHYICCCVMLLLGVCNHQLWVQQFGGMMQNMSPVIHLNITRTVFFSFGIQTSCKISLGVLRWKQRFNKHPQGQIKGIDWLKIN